MTQMTDVIVGEYSPVARKQRIAEVERLRSAELMILHPLSVQWPVVRALLLES